MTYKTILAAASGGTASNGALELACRLASRFGAHLEGFHVKIDPREVILAAGDGFGMPLPADWIDTMIIETDALAARTKAAFDAIVERHGLPRAEHPPVAAASVAWREETGHPPVLLSSRARFFDLAVLGRSERVVDQPASTAIEETLIHSGRPVLLAPAQAPASLGDSVALGWDGSIAAVRALAIALPFLAAARAVSIITIGDQETAETPSIVEHLAWHGVMATHRPVGVAAGVKRGQQLLAEAATIGADLLVMGGYGHTAWRELFFGGATRAVVGAGLLPVLLSH